LERELAIGRIGILRRHGFFESRSSHLKSLPTEMSEGAVCLRHLMSVVALLDRVALTRSRVFQFSCERLSHRHAATTVGILDDPAHRERDLARRRYFHRHLIGGATDPA